MKKLILSAVATLFACQMAFAQAPAAECEAKAVGSNGKPLAGAAKNAFMKKCTGGAPAAPAAAQSGCQEKALSKDGKPLHGAAKAAFMKKCTKGAQAAK